MKRIVLMGVFVALVAGGCLRSLHGLYTDDDLVAEPLLEGAWREDDGKSLWTFTRDGEKRYLLLYQQSITNRHAPEGAGFSVPAQFEAHLVRLGEKLFLDLFPKDVVSRNDLFAVHLIPAHTFSRVELSKDTLILAMLDHEWFKRKLGGGGVDIAHEEIEPGQYILTAKTRDLQKLVMNHADDPDAFAGTTRLSRVR